MRVNITLPEDELELIDKFAAEQGYTRSGFLLHAAKQAIAAAGVAQTIEPELKSIAEARRLAEEVIRDYCCVRQSSPASASEIAAAVDQVIKSDPSYIEQAKANIAEAFGENGMLRKRATEATEPAKAAAARRREERISPKP